MGNDLCHDLVGDQDRVAPRHRVNASACCPRLRPGSWTPRRRDRSPSGRHSRQRRRSRPSIATARSGQHIQGRGRRFLPEKLEGRHRASRDDLSRSAPRWPLPCRQAASHRGVGSRSRPPADALAGHQRGRRKSSVSPRLILQIACRIGVRNMPWAVATVISHQCRSATCRECRPARCAPTSGCSPPGRHEIARADFGAFRPVVARRHDKLVVDRVIFTVGMGHTKTDGFRLDLVSGDLVTGEHRDRMAAIGRILPASARTAPACSRQAPDADKNSRSSIASRRIPWCISVSSSCRRSQSASVSVNRVARCSECWRAWPGRSYQGDRACPCPVRLRFVERDRQRNGGADELFNV